MEASLAFLILTVKDLYRPEQHRGETKANQRHGPDLLSLVGYNHCHEWHIRQHWLTKGYA
jgi:hypothetical protein